MTDTKQKILDLFELRRLPLLAECVNKTTSDSLYTSLVELQNEIYILDKYLEEHWEIGPHEMVPLWKNIYNCLYDFGYSTRQTKHLLKHLKVYEKGELTIRQYDFPHEVQIRPFYYYKSCDVKLLRRILYDHWPSVQNVSPINHWILFDLITELIDDVEDEMEDRLAFNGNRFLFSLFYKGAEDTLTEYRHFADRLALTFKRNHGLWSPIVEKATDQVLNHLLQILDDFVFNSKPEFILPSKVEIHSETLRLFHYQS